MLAAMMVMGTTANASGAMIKETSTDSSIMLQNSSKEVDSSYIKDYSKINGISDSTIMGADFSHYQQDLEWNKVYYDYKGNKIDDIFTFVKNHGVNTISVRVVVNPNGGYAYLSLDNAVKTVKAAKSAGLNTNIILMYSDEITYANSQTLPQGWTAENAADQAKDYTATVLSTFEAANALPTMITVGNEVNYNFLDLSADGGWNGWVAMGQITQLVKEKGIKVAIGVAAPDAADDIQWILQKLDEESTGITYDYVGVSIYPNDDTVKYMETMRSTFEQKAKDKQLFVCSVKYARVSDTDSTVSVKTQTDNIYNLLSATIDQKNAGGLIYEEAEFVGSWYSFFDTDGYAQTSLAIFAYAQGNQVDVEGNVYRDPYQYGTESELKNQQVTIKKITDMSESAIRGMDISSYIALKEAGVKYYNDKGEEEDLLKILHDNGVNYIRIRIWNDPYNEKGETYGGGSNDVEAGLKIANEAKKYGMKLLLCFHYSDFWADPGVQLVPKAWMDATDDPEKMSQYVYNYTKDTVQQFIDSGAEIGMVQIGNEITNGMLGIRDKDHSKIWGHEENSRIINSYLSAGSKAVREVAPNALIALHLESLSTSKYKNIMNTWERDGVDYDVLGSSYYQFWAGGKTKTTGLDKLKSVQNLAVSKGKLFAVLETSWLNSVEDADGTANCIGASSNIGAYEVGPQGQVDSLTDIYETVLSQDNGLGAFYWEPSWIPVKAGWNNWKENKEIADQYGTGWASAGALGYYSNSKMYYQGRPAWGGSSWDNQALFDMNGYPLQSLKFYKDSISSGIEQTSVIHLVDANGKEIASSIFAKVYKGSSRNVTLPMVSGYTLDGQSSKLKVTGEVDGVKNYYVTYTAVSEIKSNKSSYTMTYGDSYDLSKEITLNTNGTIKYSSSNSKVVSINSKTGKMTAKDAGKAVITVSTAKTAISTAATKEITVTVLPKVTVKNKGVQNLVDGKSYKLSSYISISGKNKTTFSSSNKSIAKVSSDGTITAVKTGKATITVTVTGSGSSKNIVKKITVYVAPKKQKVAKVTASSKALTVKLNKDTKASGYQVMVATDKKFTANKKSVDIKSNKTVSTKVKGLKAKKQYYVRVRSYKTISGKKYYGTWSTVVKMKTK